MKKPKEKWQVEARSKLEYMGIGYRELAERIGSTEGMVRQAMSKSGYPTTQAQICKYLNISIK